MRLAFALARDGHWASIGGDGESSIAMLSESLEICGRIGFEDGKAWPIVLMAQARIWVGDESSEVDELLLDARRRFVEMGEMYGQLPADMMIQRGDRLSASESLRIAEEMVAIPQRIGGENTGRPTAFHGIAYPVWETGQPGRAEGLNRICVRSALAMGNTITLGMGPYQAGAFASRRERPDRAARLFGAGSSHFGMDFPPFYEALLRRDVDHARTAIGSNRFDELYRIGATTGPEEAATFALA